MIRQPADTVETMFILDGGQGRDGGRKHRRSRGLINSPIRSNSTNHMDDFTRPRASTSVALELRLSYLSVQRVSARGGYVDGQILVRYWLIACISITNP